MGKKSKKEENDKEKVKKSKVRDMTSQKIRKAKRTLQSSGRRGLTKFLAYPENANIRQHREVKELVKQAERLPSRPPKGQRGPKPGQRKAEEFQLPESKRVKGQSSFGSMKNLRQAYKADPEGVSRIVEAEATRG